MPNFLQLAITRHAISPRLAIRTLEMRGVPPTAMGKAVKCLRFWIIVLFDVDYAASKIYQGRVKGLNSQLLPILR